MFKQFNVIEMIKKNKVAVLIAAIVAFIIGVLCAISPFYSGVVLVWLMIVLVGIVGLIAIIKFIVPGKGNSRNGASLAMGIVVVLCVVGLLLIAYLGNDEIISGQTYTSMEMTTIRLLGFGSVFFGILAVFNNVFLLCSVGNVASSLRGFVIARSILGIIVGILMVIFPFVMFTVSVLIGGVYLVVSSIATMVMVGKIWKE